MEKKEDDAVGAVEDLKALGLKDSVVLVGITCGLSAPYVAGGREEWCDWLGQLDYGMEMDNFTCVLLGFNPVEIARNTPVEGWDKTFREVAFKMVGRERCHILNPVYGPGSIGSLFF